MYQKPTVPRDIGGVLDDTLQLYKASSSRCWLAMLLMSLASLALSLYKLQTMQGVAAGSAGTGLQALLAQYSASTPGYTAASLVVSLFVFLMYCMVVVIIAAVSRGEDPQFGASFSIALRRFPAALGAAIIAGIAAGVGFILLIIPGIYVLNRLQLTVVPAVSESRGPGESVSTSWDLVGGNWWRTASLAFVMIVMVYILGLAVIFLVGSASVLVVGAPTTLAQGFSKFAVVGVVTTAVVTIFTRPLMVAVLVAMYEDLQLRKGGGDLEARLGALPKG
jgi:hypothetical protein